MPSPSDSRPSASAAPSTATANKVVNVVPMYDDHDSNEIVCKSSKKRTINNHFLVPASYSSSDDPDSNSNSSSSSTTTAISSGSSTDSNEEESSRSKNGCQDGPDSLGLYLLDDDKDCEQMMLEDPYADVRDRMDSLSFREFAGPNKRNSADVDDTPFVVACFVYLSLVVLTTMGRINDFFSALTGRGRFIRITTTRKGIETTDNDTRYFAPLLNGWADFYTRRGYCLIQDSWCRPLASSPGSFIDILERVSYDKFKTLKIFQHPVDNGNNDEDGLDVDDETRLHIAEVRQQHDQLADQYRQGQHFVRTGDGRIARRCINFGSYNYLGFADDWQSTCAEAVKASLLNLPVSASSSCTEYGMTTIHRQLERSIANFLGKDDAVILSMGFNANATIIPALVGDGDLIISDDLNHTSIVKGARSSLAAIRTFRHNDMEHLEQVLRRCVLTGKPRTRRPWNKILVIVEGIYSMEGSFCKLDQAVAISKKYGAYVYLDEAHSIGATGRTGRGCAEQFDVDVSNIDIMMGTFSKSFASSGGYVAADYATIAMIRKKSAGTSLHNSLSPAACQQVLTCLQIIAGEDGTDLGMRKLQALRDNSNYFRMRLQDMGVQVIGQYDSPIIPIMLYHIPKINQFSRECFKRGLATVVVGAPAVPLTASRARICISATHTRSDLDSALEEIREVCELLCIRYNLNKATQEGCKRLLNDNDD